jgi:membrane fusion protein (multidrug efflux system)
MTRKSLILAGVVGVILVGAAAFGWRWWTQGRYEIATDNAYVRADITHVSAKVEGYVRAVHAADNAHVAAGAPLVTLEPADYDAQLARAQAEVARAEAEAARALADAQARRAAVAGAGEQVALQTDLAREAQAQIAAARAARALSAADERRLATLAERGFLSPSRLDQARAQAEVGDAGLRRAEAASAAQTEQIAVAAAARTRAEADVAAAGAAALSAQATLKAARAALEAASLTRGYAEMRAPIAGVVANRTVQVGQLVRPGALLLAIVPLDQAFVVANFKETQIARLQPGQAVRLKLDAFPDLAITGRVESLAPTSGAQFSLLPTDTATGNFTKITQRVPVRIAIDPEWRAKGVLRPGLSVTATVIARPAP